MRDRKHRHDLPTPSIARDKNDRARTVLDAFFATSQLLGVPKKGVSDDQARAGSRKRHPRLFDFVIELLRLGKGTARSIAAISSSVKSSSVITRRSRFFRRSYSEAEMSTVRSRPFRVTITGSVNAKS